MRGTLRTRLFPKSLKQAVFGGSPLGTIPFQ
jgi:hypothetical protein